MSIYLPAPGRPNRAPDGGHWTRLRIETICLDECALRPTSWQTLWITQTDTRRAWYGNFGRCSRDGDCDRCPVFDRFENDRLTLADHDGSGRWLVRPDPQQRAVVHLVVDPTRGWESWSWWWTWDKLARLDGWVVGRPHRDEHGEGFWLVKAA